MFWEWLFQGTPDDASWDYEAERQYILQDMERHPINPYDADSLKKRGLQWARLKRIHEKQRIEEQRALGYDTSPEFEKLFLDLEEASTAHRYQAISFQEYKEASDRFYSFLYQEEQRRKAEKIAHYQE